MYACEKILESYVARPLHQPVIVHYASIRMLHADGSHDLLDAFAGHLALTDEQKAESGDFICLSHRRLVRTSRQRNIEMIANACLSVCLTGIARIIYTIRLDVHDLTFTNADPAIWNMVESQVGFVAACIPSMGPVISKFNHTAKGLRQSTGSQSLERVTHESLRHTAPQRGDTRGFERMTEDDRVGVKAMVLPGSSHELDDFTDSIPMNGIVVQTNLEQDYRTLSPREVL